MTYGQAHNLIHNREPDPPGVPNSVPPGQAGQAVSRPLWEGLRQDLKLLTVFGRSLKASREKNGALDLSQGSGGELKFKLNSEGDPIDVQGKEEMEVHDTIAELMILANSSVAEIIHALTPQELLIRIHPPPPLSKLQSVRELALQTGLNVFREEASAELRDQLRSFRGITFVHVSCHHTIMPSCHYAIMPISTY
jgi:exoribonuclease R